MYRCSCISTSRGPFCRLNSLTHSLLIGRHSRRPSNYERPKPRSDPATEIPYPGRRERIPSCATTTLQKTALAAGHGHVPHLKFGREHNSDNDAAITRALDVTGVRPGLQLDMRHLDFGGALHALVFGRDIACCKRSYSDRYLRGNPRASA